MRKAVLINDLRAKVVGAEKSRIFAAVFLTAAALLMSFNANSFPFSGRLSGTDASVFQYVASVMMDGGMPYVDTFDHKGPILYLINALGLLIGERSGLWLTECFFILITFFYAYRIARLLHCSRVAACAVVVLNLLTLSYYFSGGNLVEEYACAFITISLYVFLEFFETSRTSPWKIILCGAAFAVVCLLRINMVVLWGVMCIGVLIYCLRNGRAKEIAGFILWFLLGVAAVCVPTVIWLWTRNAFQAFVDDYFLFNLMYSSDPSRAALVNQIKAILHFSTGGPVSFSAPILVYFCFGRQKKSADWLCMVTLVFSLLAICISGQKYGHYGMILCPLAVYAAARLFAAIEPALSLFVRSDKRQMIAVTLSVLCATLLLFLSPVVTMASHLLCVSDKPNPTSAACQIAELVKQRTDPDDKISVCGNSNIIYLLSDRESVSIYSYQSPIAYINPQIKRAYLNDLMQLKPEMIILCNGVFLHEEVTGLMGTNYEKIATVGETEIYQKIT